MEVGVDKEVEVDKETAEVEEDNVEDSMGEKTVVEDKVKVEEVDLVLVVNQYTSIF